ncbi:hypothetical protein [cf. Phormidesmis sp. LEGE 11477]|uniref:hypothetical protein n=1 Tax=cf. Phormidesmis sp. LEGE 11477 TaxID=1828680 RepID=UPI00187F6A49|nr:hypothetical protein [cf. Phormidesmis sp. LEGE 11477]MBE9063426.1 hypothetical protein [cf. Phormidesmis sp. LEGE 11477]
MEPKHELELLLSLTEAVDSRKGTQWPLVEKEEFMKRRCDTARCHLKARLKHEALTGNHGFVAALPLYRSDFNKMMGKSVLKRPELYSIDSPSYHQFIEYLAELGLQSFIDRTGRWQDSHSASGEMVHSASGEMVLLRDALSDLGMMKMTANYLKDQGLRIETIGDLFDYIPHSFSWSLYVLLPRKVPPRFSILNELGFFTLYRDFVKD